MKKELNTDGNIRKRVDGRYELRLAVGYDHLGKVIRKSFIGSTELEVRDKRDEYKRLNSLGVDLAAIDKRSTLYQAVLTHYELYLKPGYADSTMELYEALIEKHIKPSRIAGIKAIDIKSDQIQMFLNGLAMTHGAPTIRRSFHLIRSALEQMAQQRIIPVNQCMFVKKPKPAATERKILDDDEEEGACRIIGADDHAKLRDHILKHETDLKLAMAIMLADDGGLRIGEVCGLRDKDIDDVNKQLRIRTSLRMLYVKEPGDGPKMELRLQPVKTKKSRRTVPMTEATYQMLKAYRKYRAKEQMLAGPAYTKTDYLIRTASGKPNDPRNIRRAFQRLLAKLNIEDNDFHSLRHGFATKLLQIGVPLRTVSELLGHANSVITLKIYAHVLPTDMASAMAKYEEAMR